MRSRTGSLFHDGIDYNGVTFSIEATRFREVGDKIILASRELKLGRFVAAKLLTS